LLGPGRRGRALPGLHGRWGPELRRLEAETATSITDEECYTLRFDLIHEFRAFPLEDPYLPRALLPDSWAGEDATKLFHTLHDRLVGPADRHVDRVLEAGPVASSSGAGA
jgi:phenylacetic acid degradation operon negative regulatory protein